MPKERQKPQNPFVWELPDEAPGTLFEIFAAEDSRRQNLVQSELKKANVFRRCSEAIGASFDPYDLILAVMSCIGWHLRPVVRAADHRRGLQDLAKRARAAAVALEDLSLSTKDRIGWSARLKLSGLPDPTHPAIIKDLRDLASGLEGMLAKGAFKDRGGRPKMMAFEHLVRNLAHIFERSTGRPATVTRDQEGYSGQFWEFVGIVLPVAAVIIETSGAGPFAQPSTAITRGRYIEALRARTGKTPAGAP